MKIKLTALILAAMMICGCSRSLPTNAEKKEAAEKESSSAAQQQEEKKKDKKEEKAKPVKSEKKEQSESKTESAPESSSKPEVKAESKPESKAAEKNAEERDWRLILVNPDNLIPDDFEVDLEMTRYGYEVDSRIVKDVENLINAAAKDNVSLLICYGYRTLEQSQQLFEKQINRQLARGLSQEEAVAEAKRWVAPPGTSDHHTGLALDIVTPEYQVLNHGFFNTPAGQWMAKNCWDYGFVIRFPEDKQDITGITYEPWHLRFVGKEHSIAMRDNNECLEEYVARLYG